MRIQKLCFAPIWLICACLLAPDQAIPQTGTGNEPVRYVGGVTVHQQAHDGQLRPAVGVESFQVMRANRTNPDLAGGSSWTYNHAPMIIYWNSRFYIEYLSNPVGEHIPPGQTLLTSSVDGRNWEFPKVVFPVYQLRPPDPEGTAMMHQRMGFYIAPSSPPRTVGSKLRDEQPDYTNPNPDVPERLTTYYIDDVIVTPDSDAPARKAPAAAVTPGRK